jgi:transcriptional regulator with XRE-family HTH domain
MATEIVGWRIKKLREVRGMSAQKLADLCDEAGAPNLTREVITNLENGRRGSTAIDEVLVLAHVLNAPPVLLFTPVGMDAALLITPTLPPVQPGVALRWVSGEEPLDPARGREWRAVAAPIALLREFHARVSDLVRVTNRPDIFDTALRRVAEQADVMVDAGVPVPPLPRTWVDRMLEDDMLRHPDEVPVRDDEEETSSG